jgi:TolB protein
MDHLSWSPDGRRIAFLTWNLRDDGQGGLSVPSHLWVIDRDGSNLHEVLTGQTLNGIGRPLWSPDGRRFLFTARPDWVDTIFVVDADGGNLRRVVQPTLKQVNSLAWLPDGRILYQEESLDGSRSEISLINADGSGQRVLVRNAGRAGPVYANYSDPAISPDGKTIAYLVHRHAGATWQPPEIYLMNSDGTAQHKLPHGGTQLGPIAGPYLSWSPDGKKIAFTARAGGTHEIYVIGADGKNRQRLTRNNQDDAAPAWQPRPGK